MTAEQTALDQGKQLIETRTLPGMNIFHEPYSFGEFSLGYHFIFLPPRMARINILLLLLQVSGVGLVGALVSLVTRQTK